MPHYMALPLIKIICIGYVHIVKGQDKQATLALDNVLSCNTPLVSPRSKYDYQVQSTIKGIPISLPLKKLSFVK